VAAFDPSAGFESARRSVRFADLAGSFASTAQFASLTYAGRHALAARRRREIAAEARIRASQITVPIASSIVAQLEKAEG